MIKEIDGIPVKTDVELPDEELLAYVQRGREKYGRALLSVEVKIDGEYANVCYHTKKVPFDRIRRVTGYRARWQHFCAGAVRKTDQYLGRI